MATQNSPTENFESTAQLMLEILDKAGAELSKRVAECVEIISVSGVSFQKSLLAQLQCITEKYQTFTDSQSDELEKNKEQALIDLHKFKEEQIDAIESIAKAIRQSMSQHTDILINSISEQVNNRIAQIRVAHQEGPHQTLEENYQAALLTIDETVNNSKQKLSTTVNNNDNSLNATVTQFQSELDGAINEWKRLTEERFENTLASFKERSSSFTTRLDSLFTEAKSELDTHYKGALNTADGIVQSGLSEINKPYEGWHSGFSSSHDELLQAISENEQAWKDIASKECDEHLHESTIYLNQLSDDACEKIRDLHHASLIVFKKLESDYIKRLERLYDHFESIVTENNQRALTSPLAQASTLVEHQERLRNNLTSHGENLIGSVLKISEQLELDYNKLAIVLQEKIDSIKENALELLKNEVQSMETEASKNTKQFQKDLLKLEEHLKEIEEAGKAAALTVLAYRSAMLSLEEK